MFQGFPFDDVEGFGRRSNDIRSHLDDLASRHPEFADHLLGSAWGDIPAFHTGSLRNRRRGSGSGSSSSYQGHPDEDARSQASGSSANSAASGASGVSSQGEGSYADQRAANPTGGQDTSAPRRNPIPQYGLRNTVDIGQHRHNMENPDKSNRGQRSMSAPPENRQQEETNPSQDSQQASQSPNQRFVSRVDITPQFVPQQQQPTPDRTAKSHQPPQQPQQSQKPHQQPQSNVRHIPIFVEGRDEPVIRKTSDTDHTDSSWTYPRPQPASSSQFQQPPQFQSPPQFHRPSHFNQHYTRARDWLPNFEEEFYTPQTTFQQPGARRTQQPQSHFRQAQSDAGNRQRAAHQEHPHFAQRSGSPQQQSHHHPQQQQQQSTHAHQPEAHAEQPRKQTQPKDPLEKVAEVQKEVDALTEQVNLWSGTSRKDKQYMYLDEMLTRELIKLDDIETEGKDNVRQARKNAIKSIQNSISLLESKAPLPGQQPTVTTVAPETNEEVTGETENTETAIGGAVGETKAGEEEQQPIALPAAPSSPTNEPSHEIADSQKTEEESRRQMALDENHVEDRPSLQDNREADGEKVENGAPVVKVPSVAQMETQPLPVTYDRPEVEPETKQETTMDVDSQPMSPKTAKKVKKTKKQTPQQQTPVCDGAIPLPAPDDRQNDAAK